MDDDFYKILGVARTATQSEIKKAFVALARKEHTDKGGDNEKMARINQAYETLSDPGLRAEHDEKLRKHDEKLREKVLVDSSEDERDDETPMEASGYLSTTAEPYSTELRKHYFLFKQKYTVSPLAIEVVRGFFEPFKSTSTAAAGGAGGRLERSVYSFPKTVLPEHLEAVRLRSYTEALTPESAIEILLNFLHGAYKEPALSLAQHTLSTALDAAGSAKAKLLYSGVYKIITMTHFSKVKGEALFSALKKIMDYAKSTLYDKTFPCPRLFQDRCFRDFVSWAFHHYWIQDIEILSAQELELFDGRKASQRKLDELNKIYPELKRKKSDPSFLDYVRDVNLFNTFENDVCVGASDSPSSDYYREKAFHLYDWLPAFSGKIFPEIMANMLIRMGVCFQLASSLESNPVLKMVDESMAFSLYKEAYVQVQHAKPNVELYVISQILRYLALFNFKHDGLEEIIKGFQRRSLSMANLYPFFEAQLSTIAVQHEVMLSDRLMLKLLKTYVSIVEHNRSSDEKIPLDYKPEEVLYQAYEACMENWYIGYDPDLEREQEEKFRVALMEALLASRGWSYKEMNRHTDPYGIISDRDREGWTRPHAKFPIPENPEVDAFRSVDAFELNYKTGELVFSLGSLEEPVGPIAPPLPPYFRLITADDLLDMLAKNIYGGLLSLDPVDPDRQYHPFNQIRLEPSSLYGSPLAEVMLRTDYLLKMFTIGCEVSGAPPYRRRSLESLIAGLPCTLKGIITDFQKTRTSREPQLHRFWIEAGEILVAESGTEDFAHVALGELTMVVKKHRLGLDARGNVVDVDELFEGWNLYVMKRKEIAKVSTGEKAVLNPAIIFVEGESEAYFVEDKVVSPPFILSHLESLLENLFKSERDATQKVRRNERNATVNYWVTWHATRQAGKPHRFSAEYIFARQFTDHYDEFAQYFPELGRLRELSKIALLVNFLRGLRKQDLERMSHLKDMLSDASAWKAREADIEKQVRETQEAYKRDRQENYERILKRKEGVVAKARENYKAYCTGVTGELGENLRKMGSMVIDPYSAEITELCEKNYRLNEEKIRREHGDVAWEHNRARIREKLFSDSTRRDLASKNSERERNDWYRLFYEKYKDRLLAALGELRYQRVITDYIDGNLEPLKKELIDECYRKIAEQLDEIIPSSTPEQVDAIFDGDSKPLEVLIAKFVDEGLAEQRVERDRYIEELRSLPGEERAELSEHYRKLEVIQNRLREIGFAKEAPKIELEDQCMWMPTASAHRTEKPGVSGFVYGGVSVHPQVVVVETSDPMHNALFENAFKSRGNVMVTRDYLLGVRAGGPNYLRNLRIAEVRAAKEAEARAAGDWPPKEAKAGAAGAAGGAGRGIPRPSSPRGEGGEGGEGGGGRGRGFFPGSSLPGGGAGGTGRVPGAGADARGRASAPAPSPAPAPASASSRSATSSVRGSAAAAAAPAPIPAPAPKVVVPAPAPVPVAAKTSTPATSAVPPVAKAAAPLPPATTATRLGGGAAAAAAAAAATPTPLPTAAPPPPMTPPSYSSSAAGGARPFSSYSAAARGVYSPVTAGRGSFSRGGGGAAGGAGAGAVAAAASVPAYGEAEEALFEADLEEAMAASLAEARRGGRGAGGGARGGRVGRRGGGGGGAAAGAAAAAAGGEPPSSSSSDEESGGAAAPSARAVRRAESTSYASGGGGGGGAAAAAAGATYTRAPSPMLFEETRSAIKPVLFENKFPEHSIERANLVPLSRLKIITGRFNYVVTKDGNLIVGRASKLPGGGHIDLVSGNPVLAAGEVSVIDGELKYIDNSSGHYLPVGVNAQFAAESAFRKLGFDILGKYIEKIWFEDLSLPFGGAWRPKL